MSDVPTKDVDGHFGQPKGWNNVVDGMENVGGCCHDVCHP